MPPAAPSAPPAEVPPSVPEIACPAAAPPAPANLHEVLRAELLHEPAYNLSSILDYDEIVAVEDFTACGLRSLGNTCYANALVNSIAKLPSCRQWFANHQASAAADPAHDPSCMLCALAGDVARMTMMDLNEPFAPGVVRRRAQ